MLKDEENEFECLLIAFLPDLYRRLACHCREHNGNQAAILSQGDSSRESILRLGNLVECQCTHPLVVQRACQAVGISHILKQTGAFYKAFLRFWIVPLSESQLP